MYKSFYILEKMKVLVYAWSTFLLFLFTVLLTQFQAMGQNTATDSLIQLIKKTTKDTNQADLLLAVADKYYFYNPDSSISFSKRALQLSRDLGFNNGILRSLNLGGEASRLIGDYPASMKMQLEALEISRKIKDVRGESASLCFIGVTYNDLKEYRQGLNYLLPSNVINQNLPTTPFSVFVLTNIGISYDNLKMSDSALIFLREADSKIQDLSHPQLKSYIPINLGIVFSGMGEKDSALFYYFKALKNSEVSNESINLGRAQQKIANLYFSLSRFDSSLLFVRQAYIESRRTSQKAGILESSSLLVKLFRQFHQLDSAMYYEDISSALRDSLYGPQKFKQLQLLMLDEQIKQQKADREQEQFRNTIKYILLLLVLSIFLVFSFILLRVNRQKQKANNRIEKAYSELKDTQALLIQSEKMASLGELTSGIAHEIQNPLNFVNNFSEVSNELIDEMKAELDKGDIEEAKVIATDIKQNLEKINHHGKRADAIVKSMLQHSRSSTGQKEPTDINALCDEYLRLAYHARLNDKVGQGLRPKDKDFNAEMKTVFDKSIGKINIVPQDIGRVILNLINNAFYAVNEKKKQSSETFEPTVSVCTKKIDNKIEISVKDNGNGIPEKIKEKIFQPFFTTKPTGSGTGLGLSLSYDIVKAHGGEIKVATKENEGTEFTIQLPIS